MHSVPKHRRVKCLALPHLVNSKRHRPVNVPEIFPRPVHPRTGFVELRGEMCVVAVRGKPGGGKGGIYTVERKGRGDVAPAGAVVQLGGEGGWTVHVRILFDGGVM